MHLLRNPVQRRGLSGERREFRALVKLSFDEQGGRSRGRLRRLLPFLSKTDREEQGLREFLRLLRGRGS